MTRSPSLSQEPANGVALEAAEEICMCPLSSGAVAQVAARVMSTPRCNRGARMLLVDIVLQIVMSKSFS